MNKLLKILFGMLAILATTHAAITIDIDESGNLNCPGETITQIDNITTAINELGKGTMKLDWDVDRMHFKAGATGLVKINLTAPKALTIKSGNECNSENFFRSENKATHTQEFNVITGEVINISIFDWETGGGYEYSLNIEFTPDGTTPPPTTDTIAPVITLNGSNPINLNIGDTYTESGATAIDNIDGDISTLIQITSTVNTSIVGNYQVTYTVTDIAGNIATKIRDVVVSDTPNPPPSGDMSIDDDESGNLNCPGDTITQIDNFSSSFLKSAIGMMQQSWDIDRMHFKVASAGLIKINLTAPETLTIKAGNECNTETYFRSEDKISHTQEFRVINGEVINISIFDWETGGGYEYDLEIEFVSDSGTVIDIIHPVITLNGTNPVELNIGDIYTESGATAIDNIDGDISDLIQTTSTINTSVAGNYIVSYIVTDTAGNTTTKTRNIIVHDTTNGNNNYYVSPSGSDTNIGSLSNPFLTLQYAANSVNAGDTVYVREGTYDVGTGLIITKSGSEGNYITFTNYPSENPIITKQDTNAWSNIYGGTVVLYGVSYLKFNGFILKEPVGNGIFVTNFAEGSITNGSKYIEITNNVVYEQNKNVENSLRFGYAIGVSNRKVTKTDPLPEKTSNILISRNYLYANHTGSIENSYNEALTIVGNVHDYVIEDNILENNYFIGIDIIGHVDSVFPMNTNGTIQNNLLIRNGKINQESRKFTASLYVDGSEDTVIRNNTILDSFGIGIIISQEEETGTTENITVEENYIKTGGLYTFGIGTSNSGKIKNVTFNQNAIIQPNKNYGNYFLHRGNSEDITLDSNYFSFVDNLDGTKEAENTSKVNWTLTNNIYNSTFAKEEFEKIMTTTNPTVNETYQILANIGADLDRLEGVKRGIPNSDNTPPTITLNGANPQVLTIDTVYSELGATSTDGTEGDISAFIISTSTVNTSIAGNYSVTYTVSDNAGNETTKLRTVTVSDGVTPPPSDDMSIDTNEVANEQCPGDSITALENISQYFKNSAIGKMQNSWDIDRMYFTIGAKGTLKINLTAPQAITIKSGTLCNTENFYRDENKVTSTQEFEVNAGEIINLSIFDWDSGTGYDYNLEIEFTPDGITPPPVPTVLYGLEARPSNNDCFFPNKPGDQSGNIDDLTLSTQTAFPNISFNHPVGLYQADNQRWYVAQLHGEIITFLSGDTRSTTALDMTDKTIMQSEQGLLGFALHPNFPTTPYVFLSYTNTDGNSIISRFTTADGGITFDKNSEKLILKVDQPFPNHNGGNIAFGQDGYLYIGFGDGGSGNDPYHHGQNTTTLLGSMVRIDIDNGDPYAIVSNNPFAVNTKAVDGVCNSGSCPEIFAWGLRNPWRWSFDKATGVLWAGDVGQNAAEEVDIISLGKNYGWRCKEGFTTTENECNTNSFTDPILEYPNTGYNAVTGGYVYRGDAIPALQGVYLYSDYVNGIVKGYLPDHTSKTLINHGSYVASFAEDNDGELYILDVWNNTIKKIIATSGGNSGYTFPTKLSQTGCFQGTSPSSSLIPYDVNVLLWTDNLDKERWVALQDGTTIAMDEDKRQWIFPIGTVLIKSFAKDGKYIETRFLVRYNDGTWGAFTYKWNDDNSDADLVDLASSINKDIGGQIWTYPSEAQCFYCHTSVANYVLGPETAQMNMKIDYPSTGIHANQIDTYNHIGMFSQPLETLADTLDKLPADENTTASLDSKARAYLHSNCSGCHMPGGGTPSTMDLRYFKELSETKTCNETPFLGSYGKEDAKLIKPRDGDNSIIVYRLETLDESSRMPPLGTHVVDETGVQMLKDWINALDGCE